MPPPPIGFQILGPKVGASLMAVREIRGYLLNALKESEKGTREDLAAVTRTWRHKPRFITLFRFAGGDVFLNVVTDDAIFIWLNDGTRVRYAHMTRNFKRKSEPRFIGSNPGAGGLAYVSTRVPPEPGIQAREWTTVIQEKQQTALNQRVNDAIVRGLNASRRGRP